MVGLVAALAAEARTLGPAVRREAGRVTLSDGTLVAVSGIGPDAAARAARSLIEAGAEGLVSWGMAGALDPALAAGTVCLPGEVIDAHGARFTTAARWREPVAAALASSAQWPVAAGPLLTNNAPIATVAAKQAAFRATGAVAVDMESAAVAQLAALHALPFIAVRVIVDTAGDRVPPAVEAASRAGRLRTSRLVWGLLLAPAELGPLIRLGSRYRMAIATLGSVARTGAGLTRVLQTA
jgi:adenosylhomocysteine nucleosidase